MQPPTASMAALVAALATMVCASKVSSIDTWTDNPTYLGSAIVIEPDTVRPSPAIILGLHPCGGNGQQFESFTSLPGQVDALNFIMLFPTSHSQNGINCWDVHSDQSLTHDGGGESESLAGLVKAAIAKYTADTNKVFVIGASSGAMEANVLAATYPDVFKAAISYSGVPAACFKGASGSTPSSPDQSCAQGQVAARTSAEQWAALARACDAGYTGSYPRMQIVHGTNDPIVVFANFQAQLDQWSTVHGVSWSTNTSNSPVSGWTRVDYGDGSIVRGYRVEGGGHIPPFQLAPTLEFFGLA